MTIKMWNYVDVKQYDYENVKYKTARFTTLLSMFSPIQDGSTTKDFTNSPLNRFKKVNNPKSLNITYPPSPTLHVGNMP